MLGWCVVERYINAVQVGFALEQQNGALVDLNNFVVCKQNWLGICIVEQVFFCNWILFVVT